MLDMASDAPDVGKREAHKIATRRSIQAAADALFDSKGYTNTTIRDIAEAAGVTERTFFRYFDGKEALLVPQFEARLPVLAAAIRERPPQESPLDAVENAFFSVEGAFDQSTDANLAALFQAGPPGPTVAKVRPGLLLKIEQEIADALEDREPDEFRRQVIARMAIAALRSAGLRHWQLRETDSAERPNIAELTRRAFAILRDPDRAGNR